MSPFWVGTKLKTDTLPWDGILFLLVLLLGFAVISWVLWKVFMFLLSKLRKILGDKEPEEYRKIYLQYSEESAESWQWRIPSNELDIRLEQVGQSSALIPKKPDIVKEFYIFILIGYCFLFFSLVVGPVSFLWNQVYNPTAPMNTTPWYLSVIILASCASFGWMFLQVERRITKWELTPKQLKLHMTFGVFLKKTIILSRSKCLFATGRLEKVGRGTRGDMREPYYKVRLTYRQRPFSQRSLVLATEFTAEQGDWVVGGLNHWMQKEP